MYAPFTLQAIVPWLPWLDVFLGGGPGPQFAPFHPSCNTTGRRPLIGHSFLTVNNSWMTVLQTMVTVKQPQLTFGSCRMKQPISSSAAVLHLKMTDHNLMYTVDHTFGYRGQKFIYACKKIICACSWYRNQRRKF